MSATTSSSSSFSSGSQKRHFILRVRKDEATVIRNPNNRPALDFQSGRNVSLTVKSEKGQVLVDTPGKVVDLPTIVEVLANHQKIDDIAQLIDLTLSSPSSSSSLASSPQKSKNVHVASDGLTPSSKHIKAAFEDPFSRQQIASAVSESEEILSNLDKEITKVELVSSDS